MNWPMATSRQKMSVTKAMDLATRTLDLEDIRRLRRDRSLAISLAFLPVFVARAGRCYASIAFFLTGVTWIPTRSVQEGRVIGHSGQSRSPFSGKRGTGFELHN